MEKTLALMKQKTTTTMMVRCAESGDVSSIADFALRLSESRGVSKRAVANRLYKSVKSGAPLYGLHFVSASAEKCPGYGSADGRCGLEIGHAGVCVCSEA